jgi:hypothetical protein
MISDPSIQPIRVGFESPMDVEKVMTSKTRPSRNWPKILRYYNISFHSACETEQFLQRDIDAAD